MIPETLARILSRVPQELLFDVVHLVKSVIESPNPKDTLARMAQVTAHEVAAEAAIDAAFDAKKRLPNTGA